jgi:hypothetical protein
MNARQIHQRLRILEAMAPPTAADGAADLADRQKLLSFLCNDSIALELYHRYLESISGTCPHESLGSCATCWKTRMNSAEAQHALTQLEDRIRVLESPTPNKEGEQL